MEIRLSNSSFTFSQALPTLKHCFFWLVPVWPCLCSSSISLLCITLYQNVTGGCAMRSSCHIFLCLVDCLFLSVFHIRGYKTYLWLGIWKFNFHCPPHVMVVFLYHLCFFRRRTQPISPPSQTTQPPVFDSGISRDVTVVPAK